MKTGEYRLKGLIPGEKYKVKVKIPEESIIERALPINILLDISKNDTYGVDFVVFNKYKEIDIRGYLNYTDDKDTGYCPLTKNSYFYVELFDHDKDDDNKDINGNKNKQGDNEEGEEERSEEENNGDSGNDGKEVIKKKDKKKRTKREKDPKNFSIIEDVQKPENYGKDNSVISGSKIGGDMISNITSELSDAQKLNKSKSKFKQKSLISRDSKEKKDDEDEEEVSMGNMSNIKQNLFGDESKNDEDILNVMNGKDNNDNNNNDDPNKNKKNDDDNDIDINLNINNIVDTKEDNNDEKDGKKGDDKNNDDNDANKIEINDIKDNNDEDKSDLKHQ